MKLSVTTIQRIETGQTRLRQRRCAVLPSPKPKVAKDDLKKCPVCDNPRIRNHTRSRPMKFEETNPTLRIERPRCSSKNPLVNGFLIIIGFTPSKRAPWYECATDSYCRTCEPGVTDEYRRQFALVRRVLFWFKGIVLRLIPD